MTVVGSTTHARNDNRARSRLGNVAGWIAFIGLLAFCGAVSTPEPRRNLDYFPDTSIVLEGTWETIELPGAYNEGRAVYTSTAASRGAVYLGSERVVTGLRVRVFDYGKGENTILFGVGDIDARFTYGSTREGLVEHRIAFPQPATGGAVGFVVEGIGQPTALIDSLVIEYADAGLDWGRIGLRATLMASLGLVGWLATLFVRAPSVSGGRAFTSIDLMRGIGVLLVVIGHATGYAGRTLWNEHPAFGVFANEGHFGVEIFYFVSAFTLTYSLQAVKSGSRSAAIVNFWSRRFVRVIPTFFAVIVIALILSPWTVNTLSPDVLGETLTRYATLTYVFDGAVLNAIIGHSVWWSIATEFQFYILMPLLFFPVIMFAARLNHGRLAVALGLAIFGLGLAALARLLLADKAWLSFTLFWHIDAFVLGITCALVMLKPPALEANRRLSGLGLTVLGIAGLLGVVGISRIAGEAMGLPWYWLSGRLLVLIACASCVAIGRYAEARGADLGKLRWLRTVGLLSFILYLVHIPVLQVVGTWSPVLPSNGQEDHYLYVLATGLTLSFFVALPIHRLIEQPVLALNHPGVQRLVAPVAVGFIVIVLVSVAVALTQY